VIINYQSAREAVLSTEVRTAEDFAYLTDVIAFHKDKFAQDAEVLMHLVASQYITAAIYAIHIADKKLLPYLIGVSNPLARASLQRRMSS
jgi:hypothetical protein